MLKGIKRIFVDSLGNYVFFCPLVLALTPAIRGNHEALVGYLLASIPISLIGARAYTFFLKYFWYRFWRVAF